MTLPPAPHDGLHSLGEVEHRLEVHVDDGIPLFLGHALQRGVLGDTRVVDEDIDAAEVLDDFVDDLMRLLKVGGVGGISLDLDAKSLQFFFRFHDDIVQGDIGEGDVAAFLGKTQGDGLANATTSSRNQSHFIL